MLLCDPRIGGINEQVNEKTNKVSDNDEDEGDAEDCGESDLKIHFMSSWLAECFLIFQNLISVSYLGNLVNLACSVASDLSKVFK